MEIRQLRYFLAVATELNFTRAAEGLRVAQPALSQQIRQLEAEIGAKLLERSSRRVVLTPAGEVFRERAAELVEQAKRALAEAGQIGRGEAGTVSIGFVSSAAYSVLPGLLKRFRQSVPSAAIELRELEPQEQLDAIWHRRLDVGIMHATLREKHFESVVVASDRLMAAIPEGHPATQCLAVSLSALAQETFFIPKPHSHPGIYEVTVSACEKAGFTPMQIQPMRLLQTAIALVAGGLGVALVPETFKANVQVKGVVYHPLCGTAPIAELIAVWHHQNHSPIVTRLRNELRKPLRNAAG